MIKRLLSLILAILLIFPLMPDIKSEAVSDTMTKLASLVNQFPQGKYWNHVGKSNDPDLVTTTPCLSHGNCHWLANSCNCNSFDNAIQCMGYAHKISYEITGEMPRNNYVKHTTLKAADLRVGDIIRYRWNGHSICVTGVKGNQISFTDCNYIGRCQIRWGVMNLSDIVGFSYVLRQKGNQRKNSDLYFYKNLDGYESGVDLEANHEIWKMSDSTLNVRSTRKISANIVGKIPGGSLINIYDKYYDGTYIWGKVVYGDIMGWCALNYSEYVEGVIERPNLKNINEAYKTGEKITLQWDEVGGATKYIIAVYNSDGKRVERLVVNRNTTKKAIKISDADKYTAKVVATSSIIPSWRIESKLYEFSVVKKADIVKVEGLSFTAPKKIAKGSDITLEAIVEPAWATDTAVTWKSSNTSILSVNAKGKVSAKRIGAVTVTCASAENSNISCSRKITVVPDKVKNISQISSSSSTVQLTWSEVGGASGFKVYNYNSKTKNFDELATVSDNSCTMKVSAGKNYKIKIAALGEVSGKEYYGEMSDEFTVVAGPKAPELEAIALKKKVILSWSIIPEATHYVIYSVKDGKTVKLATEDADSTDYAFTDKNLKTGSYSYKIRAVRKLDGVTGYSDYSDVVTVTVK